MVYPWHPLAGQEFVVCGGTSHAGVACYHVTLADGTRTALPIWMTERAAAERAELHDGGRVSVSALVALRSLVDEVREAWTRSVAPTSAPPVSGEIP